MTRTVSAANDVEDKTDKLIHTGVSGCVPYNIGSLMMCSDGELDGAADDTATSGECELHSASSRRQQLPTGSRSWVVASSAGGRDADTGRRQTAAQSAQPAQRTRCRACRRRPRRRRRRRGRVDLDRGDGTAAAVRRAAWFHVAGQPPSPRGSGGIQTASGADAAAENARRPRRQ